MNHTITVGEENSIPIEIYFKDWGSGRPVVFSHGWPLNSDAWDEQLMLLADAGFRAIAHDRRGHGRSSQPWNGNDMDTYADDLAKLLDTLDLQDVILVGHSTGGGEVVRYAGRHGSGRVSKMVLVGAVCPHLLKSRDNPEGLPMLTFDEIRDGIVADRSQYFTELSRPFYGYNRWGAKVSQGVRDEFWLQSMQTGLKAAYDCISAFSETDFTADLQKLDVPTLIVHGDDDQIVPISISAEPSADLIKRSELKVYRGAPHGLMQTHREQFNADLMSFIKA